MVQRQSPLTSRKCQSSGSQLSGYNCNLRNHGFLNVDQCFSILPIRAHSTSFWQPANDFFRPQNIDNTLLKCNYIRIFTSDIQMYRHLQMYQIYRIFIDCMKSVIFSYRLNLQWLFDIRYRNIFATLGPVINDNKPKFSTFDRISLRKDCATLR